MSAEVETMMSREIPWHRLGTVTGEALTASAALEAAGLGWNVELRPVYVGGADKKSRIRVPGNFATVRSTDDKVFGLVKSRYVPLQNAEAFQVLDDLVGDGELAFDSAGALRGGSVVWVAAELPETVTMPGETGDAKLFAVLSHAHDGTRAIGARITPILPVCMNTLTLGEKVAKSQFSVQHRSNAKARLAQGKELLGVMYDYGKELERVAAELAAADMEMAEVDRFLAGLYADMPSERARTNHTVGTKGVLVTSPNIEDQHRSTRWGAFNAVTEWFDWKRPQRENSTVETRIRSTWEGPGRKYREKSLALLSR